MLVSEILKNAANKIGLQRERYKEADIPENMSDVCILPFFGDMRSMVLVSSLLLKRIREEMRGSKYFILLSWPGFADLFPYVSEYWSVPPEVMEKMVGYANGFENEANHAVFYERNLNYFFEDVMSSTVLKTFYDKGLTQAFLDRFKNIKVFKPVLQSAAILGNDFHREIQNRQGTKVVVYPARFIYGWSKGVVRPSLISDVFWKYMVQFLLNHDFVPVIYQNSASHDLSPEFGNKCMYLYNRNISYILTAFRSVGCVLDVFSGVSNLAILARSPYIVCEDRGKYNGMKEYEIEWLCGEKIPRERVFSFANLLINGYDDVWRNGILEAIREKIERLTTDADRNSWPSTSETCDIVPYSKVKTTKAKKFGTRFIKVKSI